MEGHWNDRAYCDLLVRILVFELERTLLHEIRESLGGNQPVAVYDQFGDLAPVRRRFIEPDSDPTP